MIKKALSINFPVERAVLSDFCPFEVPITFSNRHLYNFLVKYEVKHDGKNFSWITNDDVVDKLILVLLGLDQQTKVNTVIEGTIKRKKTDIGFNKLPSVAFTFPISHKHNKHRYLSLLHPKGQILAVDFYDNYKDLITYYSDLSSLSLRSAKRVAGCTHIDSKTLIESFDKEDSTIELEGQDYENLRSFFVYKKYRNIFEFYESPDHHWCEKRFNYLAKLDITQCFDSIYTHSIAWAVFKKDYAKKNLSKTKDTFANKFDQLMQRINYNETNGILIGPELSRIFSEIILQSVDNDVIKSLDLSSCKLGKDYQIYRYVDDYFVFYNDDDTFSKIRESLQESLKVYKLSLNSHKEEVYSRPIITPITIAKKKIAKLLSESIAYKLEDQVETNDDDFIKGSIYINQSSLSTDLKSILSDSGVTYSDILNYSLSIIERKTKDVFKDYKKLEDTEQNAKKLINATVSIINFTYFVYSVAPKVNSTIKLCRIIQQVILFIKDQKIGKEHQHAIFQCIYDNSCSILSKYSIGKVTSIETLYLLVLIRQLGKYYWLDEVTLLDYFDITLTENEASFNSALNYFTITSLLFYISNKKRYTKLKSGLLGYIRDIYAYNRGNLLDDAQMVHLTMDLLACPFLDVSFKKEIMDHYGIDPTCIKRMVNINEFWFTKWKDFDFARELDSKLSNDVY
ncbi:antiviral reverse transcriptase Drt3b [Vibrio vulnificus]|uniref:antiviral reverse transcriptase Drt3b n=1 Tax=Vibrio vulnificus TaxID=672 RepID=UPI003ED8F9D5